MITTNGIPNQNSLLIFDNFEIDYKLSKYKKTNNDKEQTFYIQSTNNNSINTTSTIIAQQPLFVSQFDINNSNSFLKILIKYLSLGFIKTKERITRKTVEYVFNLILKNEEQLKLFDEKNKEYETTIENAKLCGQIALYEELIKNKNLKQFENQLVVLNMKKYISEKNLLKFAKHCEKGLKLDWIKNFARIIPDEIIQKKIECDKLELFDNYVVLYFDPTNTSTKLTEEEKIKAKDPILFGVMSGSRKLYFVGDWKDELCTLTFEDIVKVIEEKETTLK